MGVYVWRWFSRQGAFVKIFAASSSDWGRHHPLHASLWVSLYSQLTHDTWYSHVLQILVCWDLKRSLIPFRRQTLVYNHGTVSKGERGKGIATSNGCLFVEVAIFFLIVNTPTFHIIFNLYWRSVLPPPFRCVIPSTEALSRAFSLAAQPRRWTWYATQNDDATMRATAWSRLN